MAQQDPLALIFKNMVARKWLLGFLFVIFLPVAIYGIQHNEKQALQYLKKVTVSRVELAQTRIELLDYNTSLTQSGISFITSSLNKMTVLLHDTKATPAGVAQYAAMAATYLELTTLKAALANDQSSLKKMVAEQTKAKKELSKIHSINWYKVFISSILLAFIGAFLCVTILLFFQQKTTADGPDVDKQ